MSIVSEAMITVAETATNAGSDPFTYLTGLGFPGIIIALFIHGDLHPKSTVTRLEKENDNKDQLIASKDAMLMTIMPALAKSNELIEELQHRQGE